MIDLLRFKSELEDYKKEKGEMRRVKALLVGVEEEYTAIVWEHETLSQRFAGDLSFSILDPYPTKPSLTYFHLHVGSYT